MFTILFKILEDVGSVFGVAMGIEWIVNKIKEHQKSNRRFPK